MGFIFSAKFQKDARFVLQHRETMLELSDGNFVSCDVWGSLRSTKHLWYFAKVPLGETSNMPGR